MNRCAVTILAVIAMVTASLPVEAEGSYVWRIEEYGVELPYGAYRASIAWNGDKAYIMSGRDLEGLRDTIIEFDPSDGSSRLMNARFDGGRIMSAGTWHDGYAYVFGGQTKAGIIDDIVRYDPRTDTLTVMDTRLPDPRMGASAISDGQDVYIIGGRNVTGHVNTVFRYDPSTGDIDIQPPMPAQGGGRGTVWNGREVLLFGNCPSGICHDAYRYDIGVGGGVLDTGTDIRFYWTTASWTGSSALIIGGNNYTATIDHVLEYLPEGEGGGTDGAIRPVATLPVPLELGVSFYDGGTDSVYYLGGVTGLVKDSKKVYRLWRNAPEEPDDGGIDIGLVTLVSVMAAIAVIVMLGKR